MVNATAVYGKVTAAVQNGGKVRIIDVECSELMETIGRRAFKTREDVQEWLDSAPTLDAQPIICARWRFDGFYFHCSNCGCEALSKRNSVINNIYLTDYCPNCGAKMRRPSYG